MDAAKRTAAKVGDGEGGPEQAGRDEGGIERIVEQSRRLRGDVDGLVSAVLEARGEWEARLRDGLTERPYLGLATAAGLGYVLGAGVSPGLLRAAFGIGRRVAFAVMVRRLAAPIAELIVGRAP